MIAWPFSVDLTTTNIEGVLYTMLGSLSVGASFVYAKKFIVPLNISPAALVAYQLGLSLIILFFFTDKTGIGTIWSNTHVAAGLVIGLGLLGTGFAYIIYYYIIEKRGAVSTASVAYIPPVVALIIGAIIAGENITLLEYIATALIFMGVVLINFRKKKL